MKVAAAEFKARCLALIDRVGERGEPITITKRGRVVAHLVPADDEDDRPWQRVPGKGPMDQRSVRAGDRRGGHRRAGMTPPLLDTHAWIWWVDQDPRLSAKVIEALDRLSA